VENSAESSNSSVSKSTPDKQRTVKFSNKNKSVPVMNHKQPQKRNKEKRLERQRCYRKKLALLHANEPSNKMGRPVKPRDVSNLKLQKRRDIRRLRYRNEKCLADWKNMMDDCRLIHGEIQRHILSNDSCGSWRTYSNNQKSCIFLEPEDLMENMTPKDDIENIETSNNNQSGYSEMLASVNTILATLVPKLKCQWTVEISSKGNVIHIQRLKTRRLKDKFELRDRIISFLEQQQELSSIHDFYNLFDSQGCYIGPNLDHMDELVVKSEIAEASIDDDDNNQSEKDVKIEVDSDEE
jgi:hypothetical protein